MRLGADKTARRAIARCHGRAFYPRASSIVGRLRSPREAPRFIHNDTRRGSIGRDRRANIEREAGAGSCTSGLLRRRRYLWLDDDIRQLCGMRESIVAAGTSSLSILRILSRINHSPIQSRLCGTRGARRRSWLSPAYWARKRANGPRRRDGQKAISRNYRRCFENGVAAERQRGAVLRLIEAVSAISKSGNFPPSARVDIARVCPKNSANALRWNFTILYSRHAAPVTNIPGLGVPP